MGMHISNMYSTVASTMTAQKIISVYAKTVPISKVLRQLSQQLSQEFQHENTKKVWAQRKNGLSTRAWYIKYQAYTTINKNYKRVTETDTRGIPELYVIKTEIKEQGRDLIYGSVISVLFPVPVLSSKIDTLF